LPRFWPTWFVLLGSVVLAFVPMRMRASIGDALAHLLCRLNPRRRRIALANLSLCYPRMSTRRREQLLCRHARVLAHVFLSYGELMLRSPQRLREQFDIEGLEIVQREVAAGKGIVVLTPHSLALEHAGLRLTLDHPMVVAARLHRSNDLLDWVVTGLRTRYQGTVYDNAASMLPLVKKVRAGNWLYYLPDEDRGEDNSVFAPFYGIRKATIGSLGRLARLCRAAVIPMTTIYLPETRRFLIRFHEPLTTLGGEDIERDAAEVNRAIERVLDEDPAQYMWSAKIFRTRPPGEPDLYRNL
jgi:lauroyl-KDO2-lipid IV(A) myristoyltransferase